MKTFSIRDLPARVRNQVLMKRMRGRLRMALDSKRGNAAELSRRLDESRRALEQSLEVQKESARLWRAVFENSAIGIGLLDPEGRFLQANRRKTGRLWRHKSPKCGNESATTAAWSSATDGGMEAPAGRP